MDKTMIIVLLLYFLASSHVDATVPTPLPTSIRCPGGTMYNNRCFYLAGASRNWAGCQTHCSDNGWRMLCIDSVATNNFIKSTFSTYAVVWIGLNDRTTENAYIWSGACTPANYRIWGDLQPDNHNNNEDCIEISTSTGKWNDNVCTITRGCGCESTWTAAPTTHPTTIPTLNPTANPTAMPTRQPSKPPSPQPTVHPTAQPSVHPSSQPSAQPSRQPSAQPSRQPSGQPTRQPTTQPTGQPTAKPSKQPSSQPTKQPSSQPTTRPSAQPSSQPTKQPSRQPTQQPSGRPTAQPSVQPTMQPSSQPSMQPSPQPSAPPSSRPTHQPSAQPSAQPSSQPSGQPSCQPSQQPTAQPSRQPSAMPSTQPSSQPTQPTSQPSGQPSSRPSTQPSNQPTQPTAQPSCRPSAQPTAQPSTQPTRPQTGKPSKQPNTPPPTSQPSQQPTALPSEQPSSQPSTQPSGQPMAQPTVQPSRQPSSQPSNQSSGQPTRQPTAQPSRQPSSQPSVQPSEQPSSQPSVQPSGQPSSQPSNQPIGSPSAWPSARPSSQPTDAPTSQPTCQPSLEPTGQPSNQPAGNPSSQPTEKPSSQPSSLPSMQPSGQPTAQPSAQPTILPSCQPSGQPSSQPSLQPVGQPSRQPSVQPSQQPSQQPRAVPTSQPTSSPSERPTSEWAVVLNSSSPLAALTTLDGHVWACAAIGECTTLDAATGHVLKGLSYTNNIFNVFAMEGTNAVVIGGRNTSLATTTSQVSICRVVRSQLLCDVVSYKDVYFLATSYVSYPNLLVHLSQTNKRASATVFSVKNNTAQTYIYSSPSMRSVVLFHIQSPPNFVGSFVAGTGVRIVGDLSPSIVVGTLRSDYGGLSAMYLFPMSGSILNSAQLVNDMALEYANPDSFIVGGMQLSDGDGMHAYVIRANALFESVSYCMRYRPIAARRALATGVSEVTTSVARGVVYVEGSLYMIVDVTPAAAATTIESVHSVSVLRIRADSGEITKQVNIAARNGSSFSCSNVIRAELYVTVLCAIKSTSGSATERAVIISIDRELSFKKLPEELVCDAAEVLVPQNVPFSSTVFPVTTAKATTEASQSEATQPSSVAPTYRPSSQPSSAPSGQPSSSPTSTPSVSPQPTSHPSTGGPTNTYKPTAKPTQRPSAGPSRRPTLSPSVEPSAAPTAPPSLAPTMPPSAQPSVAPTMRPTRTPSIRPTRIASAQPSTGHTSGPSVLDIDLQVSASSGKPDYDTVDVAVAVSVVGAAFLGFFWYVARKYREAWIKESAKSKKRKKFLAHEEEVWAKILQREKELLMEAERLAIYRRQLKNEEQKSMFALASILESSGDGSSASGSSRNASNNNSRFDDYTLSSLHSSERSSCASFAATSHIPGSTSYASSDDISSLHSSEMSDCWESFAAPASAAESRAFFASTASNKTYESSELDSLIDSGSGGSDQSTSSQPTFAPVLRTTSTPASSCNISSLHSSELRSHASSCESEMNWYGSDSESTATKFNFFHPLQWKQA